MHVRQHKLSMSSVDARLAVGSRLGKDRVVDASQSIALGSKDALIRVWKRKLKAEGLVGVAIRVLLDARRLAVSR